jgi:hypothetical protein
VLDVSTGYGYWAFLFNALGFEVVAHNASEWLPFFETLKDFPAKEATLKAQKGIKVHWSSFNQPAKDESSFDLIFIHTVYHDLYDMKVQLANTLNFLWKKALKTEFRWTDKSSSRPSTICSQRQVKKNFFLFFCEIVL